MSFSISHWIRIDGRGAIRDGVMLSSAVETPELFYREMQFNYPKFFKMDSLCKWAWATAEALLSEQGKFFYEGVDKNKVAVVFATSHGCLDVDKKYQQSIQSIPSPALFVYTLSNIMLGELCIRHGFKGEQACFISDGFDSAELCFSVSDLLKNRGMDACLCGWVNVENGQQDVCMFWVDKNKNGLTFSPAAMQQVQGK